LFIEPLLNCQPPERGVDDSIKVAQYKSKVAPWEAPEFTKSIKILATEKESVTSTEGVDGVEYTHVDLDDAMFEDIAVKVCLFSENASWLTFISRPNHPTHLPHRMMLQ
jgi:hypothetical protein